MFKYSFLSIICLCILSISIFKNIKEQNTFNFNTNEQLELTMERGSGREPATEEKNLYLFINSESLNI